MKIPEKMRVHPIIDLKYHIKSRENLGFIIGKAITKFGIWIMSKSGVVVYVDATIGGKL